MDEDGVVISPIGQAGSADPESEEAAKPAGQAASAQPTEPAEAPEPQPDSQAEEEEARVFDISAESISPVVEAPVPPAVGPKTAPANPPAKKIGDGYGSLPERHDEARAPQNLQEAVATIIPQNLRTNIPPNPQGLPVTPAVPPASPVMATPALAPISIPKPPISPAPVEPARVAVPVPPQSLNADPSIKPLRTYETDVAEVLSHRKISQASMAIAENKKQSGEERIGAPVPPAPVMPGEAETPKSPSHAGRALVLALLSLILIAGGIFGGYYFYEQSPLAAPPAPAAQTETSAAMPAALISAESTASIAIDGLEASAIVSKIAAEEDKPQAPDTVKDIILTETADGQTVQASPTDAIAALGVPVPDMVGRTLTPQWMLGIYADASGNKSAFVIAETDFFQNAFAGMLQWESSMPQAFQPYLPQTGSSSILYGQFQDHIVKNADVREFVTPAGSVAFLYSFVNDSTLVVAENEAALAEIIARLEQQAFIR